MLVTSHVDVVKYILKVIWRKKLCALNCSLRIYSPNMEAGVRDSCSHSVYTQKVERKGLLLLSSLFSSYWFQDLSLQKGATHNCRSSHSNLPHHGNPPGACPETVLLGGSHHIEYIGHPGHGLFICKHSVVLDAIDTAWLKKSKMFIT